ncbi:hypothetical protein [Arthrobacter sp. D2-10]
MGSSHITKLAAEITAIDEELAGLDHEITDRFHQHEAAEILLSRPGFGPVLAANIGASSISTSSGLCSVTTPPIENRPPPHHSRLLDSSIEIPRH